ncbi:hypothetical protein [Entomospira culicis]|uniref:Uncharacterized protein n=1 Tax=Entomospira culicis TaxID=2719989 RepID=A0A968GEY8_9SPIO|nr:hypothetical protein [Entomospira culicis]NIZ19157.1 hypothetical protein [Entomospira culicis]NIZ69371.1 hypothetical protein [Entomospira culicis]WDI36488.1 hypothetical protein PVA46_03975 [Entomospira culicis]WDI38114.1 hypothetical protein PVA47_03975 [Entomospira culicis]
MWGLVGYLGSQKKKEEEEEFDPLDVNDDLLDDSFSLFVGYFILIFIIVLYLGLFFLVLALSIYFLDVNSRLGRGIIYVLGVAFAFPIIYIKPLWYKIANYLKEKFPSDRK